MHLLAPYVSLSCTEGVYSDRPLWRLQPDYDYHEEGRTLQLENTPASASAVPLAVYHLRHHNRSL